MELYSATSRIETGFVRLVRPIALVGILLLLMVAASPLKAQSVGRVIYESEEETPQVRPYLIAYVGVGDPIDAAYKEVFSNPYFRAGGGFGMRFNGYGAEVLMRQGTVDETHVVPIDLIDDEIRTFSYKSTEVQLRLYGCPRIGALRIPAGIGFGLVNITVDRGYPGTFDRFGGGNFYVGPFGAIEYQVNETFAFSIEAEYAVSSVNFGRSEAWQAQYAGSLQSTVSEGSFWDTVGGAEDIDFETGGMVISMRAVIYIPTYRGAVED